MNPNSPSKISPANQTQEEHPDEISLGELIAELWIGRWVIAICTAIALIAGAFYIWISTPIYSVDALVHVEQKKSSAASAVFSDLGGFFSDQSPAQTEIEIIRSRMVLGRVVQNLHLDLSATPELLPIIGKALLRGKPNYPALRCDSLRIPDALIGTPFIITALENGRFDWSIQEEDELSIAQGRVGDLISGIYNGDTLQLRITALTASEGDRFHLKKNPLLRSINNLRSNFTVVEKGRQTGMLSLSLTHPNPHQGSKILNEVIHQYVRQNMERKAEEASKTLEFLQGQTPELRQKLDLAEEALNQFRIKTGSVDLSQEAELMLRQSVELEGQMLSMQQKKEELLRLYKEDHDAVLTINQQMETLSKEGRAIESKVRTLPRTQQEVIRLSRDVQVNNELYTSLLNNIQQLQMVRAGEIGNARIVDQALPTLKPIKPKKALIMALALLLGLFGGTGIIFLRRTLLKRVEDPRLIESKLGLAVYVTIPHSEYQSQEIPKTTTHHTPGTHLLAFRNPEDVAMESLRSLRTTLHFGMMDAPNKIIMMTGPSPGIGKSFVVSNFAAILAQAGNKVLLIDGDMRMGYLHRAFGIKHRRNGLSEILSNQISDWKSAVQQTEIEGLHLISTGQLPPNASELLMSPRFTDFTAEASELYDYILIDTPPVLAVTDAAIIGATSGTTLMVLKEGVHTLEEIRLASKRLENSGIRLKGVVFNNIINRGVVDRYKRYSYHYSYKTPSKKNEVKE